MLQPELMIITASFPAGSGEGFLEEELRALTANGAKLTVVPLWPRGELRGQKEFDEPEVQFVVRPLLDWRMLLAVSFSVMGSPFRLLRWICALSTTGRGLIRIKNLVTLPKAFWLAGIIQKSGIRHVHAHWASTTATCAMVAADLAGVPWSFTSHRWDIYEDNLLAKKVCSASFARFISRRGMKDAIDRGAPAERCVVIHMGVRVPRLDMKIGLSATTRQLRIICAANLIPVKGHRYLLDALAILHAEGIAVTLDLAGQGELRSELESQTKRLGIESQVRFRGQVKHSELLDSYLRRDFDVFVLPSIDLGNGEHEGIPVSLMEAMAHHLPVVATQTGSIEELLPRELNATVPGGDAGALADLLRRLALSVDLRQSYVTKQSLVIQKWTSLAVADALLSRIARTDVAL